MSIIQGTSKSSAATYEIDQSIRFNKSDSAVLSRTPSSTSNRKTFTISLWFKIGTVGHESPFFVAGNFPGGSSPLFAGLLFSNAVAASPRLMFAEYPGGASYTYQIATTAIFRDPSAWYHFVASVDTTQSTASDRVKLYINGELETDLDSSSYPSLNHDTYINSSSYVHRIGRYGTTSFYADGYMAEINFIDGTALDPTSFGKVDSTTGQWVPVKYTGSYGTNGFYLKGQDSSALGDDSSGNGNDFTSSGLTTADQVSDSPTANWCVWNPVDTSFNDNVTSDGNLVITTASPGYTRFQLGTFGVTSGKWEWKWTPTASLSDGGIGVDDGTSMAATGASNGGFGSQSANGVIYRSNGTKLVGGTASSYGATFAADDVIRVQLDLDSGTKTIEFFKNDASQGTINLNNNVTYFPAQFSADAGLVTVADFGQTGFTAAAGFSLLNASNLPDPTIPDPSKYFQTTLYSGNTSTQSINQSGNSTFEPSWVWIKARGQAYDHALYDAVRGATKELKSNSADAQSTITNGLTAFESDGFALGDRLGVNQSGQNYVAWQWKANGSGSSNGDGSITSTVSANTTAGFSIVQYEGTKSNATIGHGLGVVPKMIIIKDFDAIESWVVGHSAMGFTKNLFLNLTNAESTSSTIWNDTAPTSSVFSIGTSDGVNKTDTHIAYCFAEIPGFSKIGSYEGNSNADGPFVFTGFKVQWLLVKCTNASSTRWLMHDTTRNTPQGANVTNTQFFAELNNAESQDSPYDFLSNGFKPRRSDGNHNLSGRTYLYYALAETPFKTATAR